MKIPNRIKQAMKEKGMTQAELSKESGVSKSTLSEWLNDKYEPKQNNIYILSQTLGVSPTWLMGLDVEKDIKALRHTHASLLILNDVSIVYISKRLGHQSIDITTGVYSHVLEELELKSEKESADFMVKFYD